jgi:MYXO-CTERM domain-containing protein
VIARVRPFRPSLLVVIAATVLCTSLGASSARAQSLRPNILVVFDTSGSMLYNDANDGSALCGNNANGKTSRIYSLKKALRDALAQVGTDEANFGLLRYPELEDPTKTPVCPEGHYNNDATTALPVGCTGTCRGACECGCRLPTHTTETTYNTWYDNSYRSALVVDVTKRPTLPAIKPAASDFDPSDGNIANIYRWIDGTEDADTTAPISDPELRTHASWYTPIGRSLFYARMYFDNFVKPNDPKGACRTNIVIFVTDGDETCDTQKGTAINTADCTTTGTWGAFHPEVQACALNVTSKVKTYVLTDVSTSAANDAIAKAGGTGTAIRVTLTDTAAVKAALVGIIAATVPPSEQCNGKDDNCNGLIDEGVSNMCPVSNDPANADNLKGPAAAHCALETCNCLDDDCDGQVDEGFAPNACGGACGCAVPVEKCNGLDDNCDGNIDEPFNVGMACVNTGVGACKRGGILACKADMTGTFCDAPVVTPTTEVCNNIDDNCDGLVDNGVLPGVGEACGNALGTCALGTYACVNGKLTCNTTSKPMTETCNGLDDDCDGVVDNGTFPTVGQACVCPGLDPAKVGVGVCKGGKLACRGKSGIVCEGCVLPSMEICDGKDNDCDGVSDQEAKCPSGFGCREGACVIVCKPGEFPCPSGYKCVTDVCVPQRCASVTCGAGMHCDEATGQCVDLCAGVVCNSPSVCMQGKCLDCESLGCDQGQICYQGACRAEPCAGVKCGDGKYCADGKCVDLCPPGKCGAGDRCVAGQCMADKCATTVCLQAEFCDPTDGKCKGDTCQAKQCGSGQSCVSQTGDCEADPCRLMVCPTDCWQCITSVDGKGTCIPNGQCVQTKTKVGQKGGGCGCALDEAAGRRGTPWSLFAFGLLAALATRRRRAR